jgi:copper chaperone
MVSIEVKDMTCGHCVRAITSAVQAVDREAEVRIDLGAHRVDIAPKHADAAALVAAIAQAGYSPVELASTGPAPTAAGQHERGRCCGGAAGCCG